MNSTVVAAPDLAAAVVALRAGGLVAMPTETVYGLGADARNPAALRKIYAIKSRPVDHPLILHLADAAALPEWVVEVPPAAQVLAAHFWPGPLTLVLRRAPGVPDELTGGQESVTTAPWPKYQAEKFATAETKLVFQINGKHRGDQSVAVGTTQDEALAHAKANPRVAPYLLGKTVKRVIFVPGKILNVVVE